MKSESCYIYRAGQKVSPVYFALRMLIIHYTCEKKQCCFDILMDNSM